MCDAYTSQINFYPVRLQSGFINKMLTHCQKYKRHPVLMVFDSFIIHQFVSEYKIYNNNI
jgi:hypothetical protein